MFSIAISFTLVVSCMILSLYSTLRSPWTSFELDNSTYTHGLFYSVRVPDIYDKANYECLEALTCGETESDLCRISGKLASARNIFVVFEVISLVLQVFILERIALKFFNKPYGSANYFLFLIWALPIFKSLGTVLFLIFSDISFDSNPSRGEVQAKEGVFINFGSIGASILASILMIVLKVHKTSRLWRVQIKVSTGKFLNPMLMFTLTHVMFILSNVYPVAEYNEFNEVKLNIDYVHSMDSYNDNLPIQCVAGQECQISPYSCKVFKSLSNTSNIVSYIRSITYLFAILWGESFIHLLVKIRLGTNFLNMTYPILYVIFSVTGLIYYAIMANLGYGVKCNIQDFETEWALCAELGTTFYIISIIFGFLTVVTYLLIYIIYSTRAGFGKEQKVIDEPSNIDLKKKMNLDRTEIDNSAIKTAPNVKQPPNSTISTVQSMKANECDNCKKTIYNGEQFIRDGKKTLHYKCYLTEAN